MGVKGRAGLTATSVSGATSWMAHGRCADAGPAALFPPAEVDQDAVAADLCAGCPVQTACLAYALANRIDHGVWGGHSEASRRRIHRALNKGRHLDQVLAEIQPPAPRAPRALPKASVAVVELARTRPDGITPGLVAEHLDSTRAAANRRLHHLVESGHLQRIERGLFGLRQEPARV